MSNLRPLTERRWLRRLVWFLVCVCALLLLAYAFRAPLLSGLANAWVVNDPLTKADAIVVLGGSPDIRPYEAARLYHLQMAPRILYMDVKLPPAAAIGIILTERELTHRILLSNNVPESALAAIGNTVASTYDESCAVRAWMDKTGATSVIVPTELSHTRRARWIFRRQLEADNKRAYVEAIQPKQYGITNWWLHEDGLIAFQNELIKYVFYRIKY